jgi:hypothetical protein
MAQVWQRLAGQYDDGTPPFSLSAAATKQPVVQQQQQVQPTAYPPASANAP